MKPFKDVFEEYYSKLCLYTNKFIDNSSESEDIVMKIFQKLYPKYGDFENKFALNTYLFLCCKNSALDYLKINKRDKKKFNELTKYFNQEIFEVEFEMSKFLLDTIHAELNNLPKKSQTVLKLIYFENIPMKDIAERLDVTVETVRSIKRFAINKLKIVIDKSIL